MPARATVASSAAIVATRAAIATVGSAAARFATRAEVAELAGEFGIEDIVEADSNGTIARGSRLG